MALRFIRFGTGKVAGTARSVVIVTILGNYRWKARSNLQVAAPAHGFVVVYDVMNTTVGVSLILTARMLLLLLLFSILFTVSTKVVLRPYSLRIPYTLYPIT
jgi:hypothetical protein